MNSRRRVNSDVGCFVLGTEPSMKTMFVLLIVLVIASAASGQTAVALRTTDEILVSSVADCRDEFDLENKRILFNIDATTTRQLYNLHQCLDVPIGIVFTTGVRQNHFRFTPSSQTARGVLDSIIAVAPYYRWEIENGVINLLLAHDSPPLLDYRLPDFDMKNASTRSILDSLENNSAVRKRATELGFEGPQSYSLFIGFIDTRRYNFTCRDCSVRDILNGISRLDGSSWMYAEYVDNAQKKYRFGFFTSLYAGD